MVCARIMGLRGSQAQAQGLHPSSVVRLWPSCQTSLSLHFLLCKTEMTPGLLAWGLTDLLCLHMAVPRVGSLISFSSPLPFQPFQHFFSRDNTTLGFLHDSALGDGNFTEVIKAIWKLWERYQLLMGDQILTEYG